MSLLPDKVVGTGEDATGLDGRLKPLSRAGSSSPTTGTRDPDSSKWFKPSAMAELEQPALRQLLITGMHVYTVPGLLATLLHSPTLGSATPSKLRSVQSSPKLKLNGRGTGAAEEHHDKQ
ncbi:hypothetical protein HRR90_008827 [Exophiala dermatitidis]|nr:hypothetical protein HRR74_008078 [Exophiala dermatitidis]KAJ4517371.1 hypothetical protein HRR73_004423 [Exophiala dermatitidis]KAJ4595988.1 hypothetical protein HRR84_005109 [Exophiala dermatitidis]KAJ4640452.1 hypothetical protein HRR91_008417 [Exophiala dermatitidis]KAJ4641349.1 hypothetical protein HRR90_008827 [Exophiala dermatitidis]